MVSVELPFYEGKSWKAKFSENSPKLSIIAAGIFLQEYDKQIQEDVFQVGVSWPLKLLFCKDSTSEEVSYDHRKNSLLYPVRLRTTYGSNHLILPSYNKIR